MTRLIYVADPMCSWCWGFRPVLERVREAMKGKELQYVMGGLAPDTDEPMPGDTRAYVQEQWRKVTEATGAEFNWDFWEVCRPRRSTYPACRAVIAAGLQGTDRAPEMFEAIQRAYYRQAGNPSDGSTLTKLADEIGLDADRFSTDLESEGVEQSLQDDFTFRRALGADRFPSLILQTGESRYDPLTLGYADAATVLARLDKATEEGKHEGEHLSS
jgi:putative protein-disulfide isomerase